MKTATKPKPGVALAPLLADAVLLALDCSSSAIGWAVFASGRFDSAGLIRSPAGWGSERRIRANAADVLEMMIDGRVTNVAMEWQGSLRHARGRNVNGLAVLGQSQGYLLAAIEREHPGVSVDLIGERLWTRMGGWNISKARRAERVKLLVPEYREATAKDPKMDPGGDIADAIGIGLFRLAI